MMEKLGRSYTPYRNLYIVELENLQTAWLDKELLGNQRFVCLVVGDFVGLSCESISIFGKDCIEAGAVYFCVWGPDCEKAHDCIDIACDHSETDETTIMTTWHEDEPLYEALYYAIKNTCPADACQSDCTAMVTLVINNLDWSLELRKWMIKPEELVAKVLSELRS